MDKVQGIYGMLQKASQVGLVLVPEQVVFIYNSTLM